ncbi:cytochrome P450 6A1 [Diaporthe helianthi]|uniref:Cytochrome P450 6A1 n=1 Tax=Diaporthe helianthi TaxID=158607 RepID=A0A2P5HUA2_DIAHE|nr:cytochrome P450 6A1 [Diaporthe helianthi]
MATSMGFVPAVSLQNWPASIYILLLSVLAVFIKIQWQPSFPKNAPKKIKEGYPLLGALRLFTSRAEFFKDALTFSNTGNFSLHFGKHQVVGMSGAEGRKTFFDSKDLDMSEGYAVMFAAAPQVGKQNGPGQASQFSIWFTKTITKLMKKENFVQNLGLLTSDTTTALDAMVKRTAEGADQKTGTFDPFHDIYHIVYQLTMRTVGATEIAESPELLARTLGLFEEAERNMSTARIIFPWMPTIGYIRRTISGGKLYVIFDRIAKERRRTGKKQEDAFQFLMDSGEDIVRILTFVLGALFAGQLNSGVNAGWLLCYLATNPEWYGRIQGEVDAALNKHRTRGAGQTPAQVLSTLTLDDWESEFPLIDLALRESIRFQLVGTAFRKNISGHDVPIGKSGEVVPSDGFAMYWIDDVHFNPEVYTNPTEWDPSRFLPERAEDKKVPFGYLGWGVGRHPCLGMRFAKLEMSIIVAMFVAMFDFELFDDKGVRMEKTPFISRNRHSAKKPDQPMRLRYTVRQH